MKMHTTGKWPESFISIFVVAFLTGFTAGAPNELGTISKEQMDRWTRNMNMMRLGKRETPEHKRFARDVPMLRLGRRSTSDQGLTASQVSNVLLVSRQQLLEFIKAALEQEFPRSEMRRQPPLPRYGRRSGPMNRNSVAVSSREQPNTFFPFDITSEDDPVFRPPPRGGRYKREASSLPVLVSHMGARSPLSGYLARLASKDLSQRTPPLPRIGRQLTETVLNMAEKAVPRPRIGRSWFNGASSLAGNAVGENSKESKEGASQNDPMADPRSL